MKLLKYLLLVGAVLFFSVKLDAAARAAKGDEVLDLRATIVTRTAVELPKGILALDNHAKHGVAVTQAQSFFHEKKFSTLPDLAKFFDVDWVMIHDGIIVLNDARFAKDGTRPYYVKGFFTDSWLYDKCAILATDATKCTPVACDMPTTELPEMYGKVFLRTATVVDAAGRLVVWLFDNQDARLRANCKVLGELLKSEEEVAEEAKPDNLSEGDTTLATLLGRLLSLKDTGSHA